MEPYFVSNHQRNRINLWQHRQEGEEEEEEAHLHEDTDRKISRLEVFSEFSNRRQRTDV
jgi:hypothetical protein